MNPESTHARTVRAGAISARPVGSRPVMTRARKARPIRTRAIKALATTIPVGHLTPAAALALLLVVVWPRPIVAQDDTVLRLSIAIGPGNFGQPAALVSVRSAVAIEDRALRVRLRAINANTPVMCSNRSDIEPGAGVAAELSCTGQTPRFVSGITRVEAEISPEEGARIRLSCREVMRTSADMTLVCTGDSDMA